MKLMSSVAIENVLEEMDRLENIRFRIADKFTEEEEKELAYYSDQLRNVLRELTLKNIRDPQD